jgi:putative Holliday junction resolvase
MRYLGIDHGQKRTGLAISDASEMLVTPHTVIETQSATELLRRIMDVITAEHIEAIVIGLPLNMDGSDGARVKQVKGFASQLAAKTACAIIFHDERLSSFEADYLAQDLDLTRKKKKKRLDAIAAAAILRSYLDQKKLDIARLNST